MEIPIDKIKICPKQIKKLDRHKVEKHRRMLEGGGEIHPIDVVRVGGYFTISGNGRHRFYGAVAAGWTHIRATILND